MKKTLVSQITDAIESTYDINGKNMSGRIVVYPCGDVGIQVISIMKNVYGIQPAYIIDDNKYKYSEIIKPVSFLNKIDLRDFCIFIASTNSDLYPRLYSKVENIANAIIVEIECMRDVKQNKHEYFTTQIGKYSYGPICRNHELIKSIGAFCSFAEGVDYVLNHEIRYITTHPIIYCGKNYESFEIPWENYSNEPYYMGGGSDRYHGRETKKSNYR